MDELLIIFLAFLLILILIFGLKAFLYAIASFIILPFIICGFVIYVFLQLACKYYSIFFEKVMAWVDENITPNL